MRISDWSSDVCSSDLTKQFYLHVGRHIADFVEEDRAAVGRLEPALAGLERTGERALFMTEQLRFQKLARNGPAVDGDEARAPSRRRFVKAACDHRSEEHTSELPSLMRISYAVFCLKKKQQTINLNAC